MHILLPTCSCNEKYDTFVEIKKLNMHVSSYVDIFLLILKLIIKVEHKSFKLSTQLEMSGCTCYWRSQVLVRYYCCHCTCAASYLQRSFAAWLLWRTIAK